MKIPRWLSRTPVMANLTTEQLIEELDKRLGPTPQGWRVLDLNLCVGIMRRFLVRRGYAVFPAAKRAASERKVKENGR